MKYFQLKDRLNIDRWFLGEIYTSDNFEIDIWDFLIGSSIEKYKNIQLAVEITHKGTILDFTFAGFDIPIVSEKVLSLISNDVTALPVDIVSKKKVEQQHFVIFPNYQIDCIDEEKSIFHKWEEGNNIRPDLSGKYSFFEKLVIDTQKIDSQDFIRIKNLNGELIVSNTLRRKFIVNKITGIIYKSV